jgi:hypothetical protein
MMAVLFRVPEVPEVTDLMLSPEPHMLMHNLRGFLYYFQANHMTTPYNMLQ